MPVYLKHCPCLLAYCAVVRINIALDMACVGQQVRVRHVSVHGLLPPTPEYMTYEGSMTYPACHETVTWLIANKPVYISSEDVSTIF